MAVHKLLTLTLPSLSLRAGFDPAIQVTIVIGLGLALAWLPVRELVLLLGGAIFLTLILLKPLLSVYLLIPIIPFSGLLTVPLGSFRAGVMEMVLVLGIIAWLLQWSVRSRSSLRTQSCRPAPAPPRVWPWLIWLGGVSLSWFTALSIGFSLVETIKWLEMLALYLLVVALLPVQQVKWVVITLLLAGLVQAVLGLYQFVFKVGPEGFLLFGGLFLRAYGTFAQPNPYAGYLGLVLPLALSLVIWQAIRFRSYLAVFKVRRPSLLSLLSPLSSLLLFSLLLGLLLAALFASQSRGAWLGFAMAAVITMIAYSKKTAAILASLAFIGTMLGLAGSFEGGLVNLNTTGVVIQRLEEAVSTATVTDIATVEVNDANFATIERLAHWQAAREMWRDHPWLGVGFGNYAVVYPAYAVGRWLDPLGHAHNYLLNIGAETGLVGLIAYFIFWLSALQVTWSTVQASQGFAKAVAVGGLGILAHLHIHNLFDNLYVQGMYLHVAIILALMAVVGTASFKSNNRIQIQCWYDK